MTRQDPAEPGSLDAVRAGEHLAEAERRVAAVRARVEAGIVAARPGAVVTGPVTPAEAGVPRIPGDQLLDLIRDAWFGRYARFPSAAALDTVTLWAAHCHMRDAAGTLVTRVTPRLYLLSSQPGSGKTAVLELLSGIVPACFGLDVEPTMAGLVHTIASERATVLIDEADVMFGRGQRKADVRAVLNAGYRRKGTVLNGRGAKAVRVPVFGPVAVAGLDTLITQTGEILAALLSRGITIRMRKASPDDPPLKLTAAAETAAGHAREWLTAWAGQVRGEVTAADPAMPQAADLRTSEIWVPLIAVADSAGGQWPGRARAAMQALSLAEPGPAGHDEDIETAFAGFAGQFAAAGM